MRRGASVWLAKRRMSLIQKKGKIYQTATQPSHVGALLKKMKMKEILLQGSLERP